MKLKEINKKEFYNFAKDEITNNFQQSREWAELKRLNGWHTYFLGIEDEGQIKACCLLLSKEIPIIKKRVFYSPRGFIINYKNLELLRIFTKYIKEFIQNKKGIFLRISPYLSLKDLDNNGEYIQGGYNNDKCIDILRSLGYCENTKDYTEPRQSYILNLDNNINDIYNNMTTEVKNTIKSNERKGIYVRNIKENEINTIIDIINKSNNKVCFIENDLHDFYRIYTENDNIIIRIVEIDIDKYIENANDETEKEEAKEFAYKYGHKVILGCSISICYENEVINMVTAITDKFKNLLPQYTLTYEEIKYAKENGYTRYNFNGIDDNLDKSNLRYIYCRGFNGKVLKLLGEFDLVFNPFLYKLYIKNLSKKKNNL